MAITEEERAAMGLGSNVVALPRAAAAGQAKPDPAGQAIQLGTETGIAPEVVHGDLPAFQSQFKEWNANAAINQNKFISDYVARNEMAAEVSNDDYSGLDNLSRRLQNFDFVKLLKKEKLGFEQGFGYTPIGFSEENRKKYPVTAQVWQPWVAPIDALLRAPGGVVGAFASGVSDIYEQMGGSEAWAKRLDRDLRIIGMGLMVEPGMGGHANVPSPRQLTRDTPVKEAGKPSSQRELDEFVSRVHGFNTRAEIDEFLARRDGGAMDKHKETLQIEHQKLSSAALDGAVQAAGETNTKTRAPTMLQDFAAGHEAGTISLPAKVVADLYNAEGKVPGPKDGLLGFVPGLKDNLEAGIVTGVEFKIPVADYIAHIDAAVHTKLKDNIRFSDDGVTGTEIAEAKEIKDLAKEKGTEIEVWHGSPHEFEAVDMSKIGTGEGAQSYGHGSYWAEQRKVAEEYATKLTSPTRGAGAMTSAGMKLSDFKDPNLYRAVISAPREAFLDWDRPIKEQTPELIQALAEASVKELGGTVADQARLLGELSTPLGEWLDAAGGGSHGLVWSTRKDMSDALLKAGIPGIRYLDQGSRDPQTPEHLAKRLSDLQDDINDVIRGDNPANLSKEAMDRVTELEKKETALKAEIAEWKEKNKTSNFVIFDPSIITILERNGQLLRDETAKAELNLGLRPLFSQPLPSMDKPLFDRYNELIKKQQQALIEKTREWALGKNRNEAWKAKETEMRAVAEAELAVAPDLVADKLIRNGKLPSGETLPPAQRKLSDAAVEQILGKDHSIPDSFRGGVVHPDDIAPLVGYNSGAAMVKDLDHLNEILKSTGETPAQYTKRLVDERTLELTSEVMGETAKIEEAARALALSDIHLDILSAEMKALAAEANVVPPYSREQMKDWVQAQFETSTVEIARDYKRFQASASRAGRKTEMQLMKGDTVAAFQAKQQQVLAFMLSKESERFGRFLAATEKTFDKIMRKDERASTDQEFFDQTRSMLASVGYVPSRAIPEGLSPLAEFVDQAQGTAAVAAWLKDGTGRAGDPRLLTVERMRELRKSVDSMMKAGRDARQLENIHGRADLDNVVVDIIAELDRFDLIQQPLNPSIRQRAGSLVRSVNAWSLLVERMLDYTDKFNPTGPLTAYMDRPLRDANVKEIELNEKVTYQLRKLSELTDSSINDVIPNNVIRSTRNEDGFLDMTRRNLRQLMGYTGSKSGMEKVLKGFKVEEADLRRLINENATEADWKWVAGMHEIFEGLWKESATMQERYTGVVADKVNPVKMVSDKYGEFPGGYWPIKYDKLEGPIDEHLLAKNQDLFHPTYVQAVTPQSYTIARTGFVAPLDLSGQMIASHIRGVIHDIAFREAVRNAQKLVSHPEFMSAMKQKWSAEYAGLLPGWLKDIANSSRVDDSYAMGAARWASLLRQNITNALIGMNPSTVIKHGMSATGMSIVQVGAKDFATSFYELGFREALKSGRDLLRQKDYKEIDKDFKDALLQVMDPSEYGDGTRQFILDSSAVMRNRQRQSSDNIREQYEKNVRDGATQTFVDIRNVSMDVGRVAVAVSDALSAMPTWLAAYRREMTGGANHADAVFVADKEVSRAHGSSFVGDKPRVLRTDEPMRWVTPLYNFWNHMQNNLLQWMWDAGAKIKGRDEPGATVSSLSNRMFWLAIWSIVAEELATPALDEHKQSWGQRMVLATVRHFGGGYIGLRDFTNAAAHGADPTMGLGGTLYKEVGKAAKDVNRMAEGKKVNENWLIHAVTMLSFATGIGNIQSGKTGSYAKDLATGRERSPKSFNEFRQGVRTGHSKPRIFK